MAHVQREFFGKIHLKVHSKLATSLGHISDSEVRLDKLDIFRFISPITVTTTNRVFPTSKAAEACMTSNTSNDQAIAKTKGPYP